MLPQPRDILLFPSSFGPVNVTEFTPCAQDIRVVTVEDEVTYIEVKSTTMVSKPFFEISMQELLFAHSGAAYHIYRVSGAFSDAATIAWVPDLVDALRAGQASLAVRVHMDDACA